MLRNLATRELPDCAQACKRIRQVLWMMSLTARSGSVLKPAHFENLRIRESVRSSLRNIRPAPVKEEPPEDDAESPAKEEPKVDLLPEPKDETTLAQENEGKLSPEQL